MAIRSKTAKLRAMLVRRLLSNPISGLKRTMIAVVGCPVNYKLGACAYRMLTPYQVAYAGIKSKSSRTNRGGTHVAAFASSW
jgi:hypothetical protein